MKVALIHDYLREYGGAERVVEALHEIWPEAPLYTSFVDWASLGDFAAKFREMDIRTTWVEKCWLVKKWHSPLRFLTPLIWESLDLRGFDVVISSSGWYICRGVITRPETIHISYIHHPPRYLYGLPTGRRPSQLIQIYAGLINPFLRVYDFATAQRVDYLIANSQTTRRRIQKYYRRDAEVIYPPATLRVPACSDTAVSGRAMRAGPPVQIRNTKYEIRNTKQNYYLSVGRLTYAKRVDLAIHACNQLKLPLKIVGTGIEEEQLRRIAGPTIEFLGTVSDDQLGRLYSQAKALLFTALQEDFGMVPVEAMSYGTPVIALRQGGAVETVVNGKTGLFFNEPEVSSLVKAIEQLGNLTIKPSDCIKQAQKFSKQVFKKNIKSFVEKKYQLTTRATR